MEIICDVQIEPVAKLSFLHCIENNLAGIPTASKSWNDKLSQ